MSNHVNIESFEATIAALGTFGSEVTENVEVLNTAVGALVQTMQDDQPSMAIAEKVHKFAGALQKVVEYSAKIAESMQKDLDEAIAYRDYMAKLAEEE